MTTLQARRLPPTNSGRPDVDPAFLYIYTYPVSSCWLFEQCSKFNPHPYVHSLRPELGDRNIACSFSPYSLYSDSIPMVTGSPLTPTTPKMPFPMEGFGDSEGGGKKTVRWFPYMVELDSSNSLSYEVMPTESGSVGKEDKCALPVRNLLLDGTGSSYVVPAVLSYVSSNGEKNEGEP